MTSKQIAFLFWGYFIGTVSALSDLTEIQLLVVVFMLGGILGAVGKFIRKRKSESLPQAVFIGMGIALVGILLSSLWEDRIGRNGSVGVALVLAMMGGDGYKLIIAKVKDVAGVIFGGKGGSS